MLRCKPVTYVVCSISDRPYRTDGMNRCKINEYLHNEFPRVVHEASQGTLRIKRINADLCEKNTMQHFALEIVHNKVEVDGFKHVILREMLIEDGLEDAHPVAVTVVVAANVQPNVVDNQPDVLHIDRLFF